MTDQFSLASQFSLISKQTSESESKKDKYAFGEKQIAIIEALTGEEGEGDIVLSTTEIADLLGTDTDSVYQTIKKLVKRNKVEMIGTKVMGLTKVRCFTWKLVKGEENGTNC